MKEPHHTIIQTKPQENGLWGTPTTCISIDNIFVIDKKYMKVLSALIISLTEEDPYTTFCVNGLSDQTVLINKPNKDTFSLKLDDYRLDGNILYWIGDKANKRLYNIKKVLEDDK